MERELLSLAMQSPDFVDDLFTIVATDDAQMLDPLAGAENTKACHRLEARLSGGTFTPVDLDAVCAGIPAGMGRESDTFYQLHYNAKRYVTFLMRPEQYPDDLRADADAAFPPLGHDPQWTVPPGFRLERGLLGRVHAATSPNTECRFRQSSFSPTVIIVERPSATEFRYPWQQAISAHRALFGPGSRFERISARYVPVGPTKALEVCYREGPLAVVKLPVLLEPGTERMFEFHTPSPREEKPIFDAFIASLR